MRRAVLILLVATLAGTAHGATKRGVLLIGIDGCRPDGIEQATTPNLDKLIARGVFVRASCLPPRPTIADSVSGPGWATIVTGVWAEKHGIRDNTFKGIQVHRYPHFFVLLRRSGFRGKLASVVHWKPIAERLVSEADINESYSSDDQVADRAVALLQDASLGVLFVHFDDADHAGHRHGFHPRQPEYRAAIEAIDRRVGRLLEALKRRLERGSKEDWLVLVTSDHGGSGKGHGGGARDLERRTSFIIAAGRAFEGKRLRRDAFLADVAPTALYHLLGKVDPAWELDGRPLQLDLEPE